MGVKKLFFWLTLGFFGGILLFSILIPQNMGVAAQKYEPGNNTTWISSGPAIETVIRSQELAGNLTSRTEGNLTSEMINASGNTELTVYEQGIALVKEKRDIDLHNGVNRVEYTDIASGIDPTSVIIEDTENKDVALLEQNYEYDLLNISSLLEKYLGREVNVTDRNGKTYTGTLLSHTDNSLVLKTEAEVIVLEDFSKVELADSSGLSIKPALVWRIYSPVYGTQEFIISYLTSGISWEAAYVLMSNAENTEADIRGWVNIDNRAGITFNNAVLKLVSGQINRVTQPPMPVPAAEKAVAGEAATQTRFVEEPLFEYHLYTLKNPTTLENNQAKQISLLSADSVPVEKKLIYDSSVNEKVLSYLTLQNTNESGLGMPLPKGVVRIYTVDSSGGLQFLGEDQIKHTPEGGELRVTVGSTFDLTAKRNETNYQRISDNVERVTYQIELNNSKLEDQAVTVVEHLFGEWEVLENSDSYEKTDAFTIEFRVTVPARSTKLVSYTVERRF